MSFRVRCPNGHELVAELSYIGRKIRCPACKAVMVVPDPNAGKVAPAAPRRPVPPPIPKNAVQPPPPRRRPVQEVVEEVEEVVEEVIDEEPSYEDDRPRKKGMKTGSRMRLANVGLAFHYAKIACIIGAMILMLIVRAILGFTEAAAAAGSRQGTGAGIGLMGVLGCLSFLLMLATPLLGGTGSLLCFWVPAKSRARVLVIVSFSMEVGGVVLMILGYILALGSAAAGSFAAAGSMGLMSLLAVVASLAGFILFMLFLRALANFVRDSMSAQDAMRLMILILATGFGGIVVLVLLTLVLFKTGKLGQIIIGLCGLGWFVGMLFIFIGILRLIGTLRARINRRWG